MKLPDELERELQAIKDDCDAHCIVVSDEAVDMWVSARMAAWIATKNVDAAVLALKEALNELEESEGNVDDILEGLYGHYRAAGGDEVPDLRP